MSSLRQKTITEKLRIIYESDGEFIGAFRRQELLQRQPQHMDVRAGKLTDGEQLLGGFLDDVLRCEQSPHDECERDGGAARDAGTAMNEQRLARLATPRGYVILRAEHLEFRPTPPQDRPEESEAIA